MSFFIILLFLTQMVSASLLSPIFECQNESQSFSLIINPAKEASIHYKRYSCPVKVVEFSHNKNRAGRDGLNLNFVVNNCNDKIFYKKGFIKIESDANSDQYRAYVLALKGKQTFECKTSKVQLEKLIKLEKL